MKDNQIKDGIVVLENQESGMSEYMYAFNKHSK